MGNVASQAKKNENDAIDVILERLRDSDPVLYGRLKDDIRRLQANDPTLTSLDFSSKIIGAKGALALVVALERNTTLRKINLSSNKIGYAGAAALTDTLERNTTLTSIELDSNDIGAAGAVSLATALVLNVTLTEIGLGSNDIGDAGAFSLATALRHNRTLMKISLANNDIGVEGADALTRALEHNTTLMQIILRGNDIGDAGAVSVKRINEICARNKARFDSASTLTTKQTSAVASAMVTSHTATTTTAVTTPAMAGAGGTSVVTAKAQDSSSEKLAEEIRRLQANDPTLTSLYLRDAKLGDAGAASLAAALARNNTLLELDLRNNEIGVLGLAALATALERHRTLTWINLMSNGIEAAGAEALANALEHNTALTSISLCASHIGDTGAAALATALERNSTLTSMYLSNNNIGDAGAAALATALERNYTLTWMTLDNNNISDAGAVSVKRINEICARNNQALHKSTPVVTIIKTSATVTSTSVISQAATTATAVCTSAMAVAGGASVVATEPQTVPVAPLVPFNEAAFRGFAERLVQVEDIARTAAQAASVSEALLQNETARIARLEFEYIVAKPLLQDYYQTLQASLYDTFLAAFTIHSGMVANQKTSDMQSYVSMGVSVIDYFCQSIPIASHITSAATALLNKVISVDQTNKVNRLLALLPDHTKAAELANRIARALSLAFEEDIVRLVKTEHPLIHWLKAQRDKLIFNDIDTPQKAEAAVHAMQLIKLAMQAALSRIQLETDDFIILIKPGYDLRVLQTKRDQIYACSPVASTPTSMPFSPLSVSVISPASTTGNGSSPLTGMNTTPFATSTPTVSPAELAELREANNTVLATLRKEIKQLASRLPAQAKGHEPSSAGSGLAYADSLNDASSRATLTTLQQHVSLLSQTGPQVEVMLTELQEISERLNPITAAAEFSNQSFAFERAVKVIKHLADDCYGVGRHTLTQVNIAKELQGPAVSKPPQLRGEAILNVLRICHLATFVSITQLKNRLNQDEHYEPVGQYRSAAVTISADQARQASEHHALLTPPG